MRTSETFFCTNSFPPSLRTEAWRDRVSLLWDCLPSTSTERPNFIEGTLRSTVISSMLAVRANYSTMFCRRDEKILAHSEIDHYLIHIYSSGEHIGNFEGRESIGRSGDIRIIDLSKPFSSNVASGKTISLMVPRTLLASTLERFDVHGVILKPTDPVIRLLRNLILGINAPNFSVTPEQGVAIEESVSNLLRASLSAGLGIPREYLGITSVLREEVSRFISVHLANPDLGPEMLTRHFRLSRAHLYRMFEGAGGVARFIRTKRLDAAYRSLLNPAMRHQNITQIAYGNGFANNNQFLRAFRARFGVAPSDVRSPDMRTQYTFREASLSTIFSGVRLSNEADASQ